MTDETESGAGGNSDRPGADRLMRRADTDDIEQERHGEDRAPAAD